jgi:hypothetical protein
MRVVLVRIVGQEANCRPGESECRDEDRRLEPALATVFTAPTERRQAAKSVLAVTQNGTASLPNVGALARVKTANGPLLTGSQLAAVKPYFAVRTAAEFQSAVLWCALAMVVAFQVVRWCGGCEAFRAIAFCSRSCTCSSASASS